MNTAAVAVGIASLFATTATSAWLVCVERVSAVRCLYAVIGIASLVLALQGLGMPGKAI